eukprot:578346-Pyramimonas_sp.AAC.1
MSRKVSAVKYVSAARAGQTSFVYVQILVLGGLFRFTPRIELSRREDFGYVGPVRPREPHVSLKCLPFACLA